MRAASDDQRNVDARVRVIDDDPAKTAEAQTFVARVTQRLEWMDRTASGTPLLRSRWMGAASGDPGQARAPVGAIDDDPVKTAEAVAFVTRVTERLEWMDRVASGRPLLRSPVRAQRALAAKVPVRAVRPRAPRRTRRVRSLVRRRAASGCRDPDPELPAAGATRRFVERVRRASKARALAARAGNPR